ncbi:MAG: hypothetical protein RM347_005355 [Nostoc sp. ChiQUE02]|nr:hypothetical protein [Nostoc sp. ChiQUE02]MDZ8231195.1 hypothetical protein [Nostoc sp. ChiQUE02]
MSNWRQQCQLVDARMAAFWRVAPGVRSLVIKVSCQMSVIFIKITDI